MTPRRRSPDEPRLVATAKSGTTSEADAPGEAANEAAGQGGPLVPEEDRPTRSAQTRAAATVNRLGLQLSTLSPAALDRLELPERLREAVDVAQRLKPRSRGRQIRRIGQLLRADDHEAIRERVESLDRGHNLGVHHEKMNDRWLARLVEEGDSAVEALIADFPDADRQQIRSLTRNARQDPELKKTRRARRELLRTIRALRG